MNFELIKVRLVAFAYEAGSMIGLAILGVIFSPEFEALVAEHAGEGIIGSMIVLTVSAILKHLRNVRAIKAWESTHVGAAVPGRSFPTLI